MDTLAFIHAAIDYEDPNPFPNPRFKDTDLKAASSVAMGFIASGVVTSTLTYADAAQATLYYGSRGSDVVRLQKALGNIAVDGIFGSETSARLKSYQAKKGLIIDGIAGSETLSSLGLFNLLKSSKGQNIEVKPEQHGRLQLINDTPYMVIVSLYEPGNEQPSKYGYIPPCAKRTLSNTYSSSWKVSFNKHGEFLIGEKADKKYDVFEVKLSKLSQGDISQDISSLCEFDDLKALAAKPVDNFTRLAGTGKFFSTIAPDIGTSIQNFDDARPQLYALLEPIQQKFDEAIQWGKNGIDNLLKIHRYAEDYSAEIDQAIAWILSNHSQPDAHHEFLASQLRRKLLLNELDLNNPDSIENIVKKWLNNCPQFPALQEFTKKDILNIIELLKNFQSINQDIPKMDSKDVNSSKSINPTVAQNLRNCQFTKNQHPIFVNLNRQFQRIIKSCKI